MRAIDAKLALLQMNSLFLDHFLSFLQLHRAVQGSQPWRSMDDSRPCGIHSARRGGSPVSAKSSAARWERGHLRQRHQKWKGARCWDENPISRIILHLYLLTRLIRSLIDFLSDVSSLCQNPDFPGRLYWISWGMFTGTTARTCWLTLSGLVWTSPFYCTIRGGIFRLRFSFFFF